MRCCGGGGGTETDDDGGGAADDDPAERGGGGAPFPFECRVVSAPMRDIMARRSGCMVSGEWVGVSLNMYNHKATTYSFLELFSRAVLLIFS